MGPERLGLGFLLRPDQQVNRVQSALHSAQDSPQYQHVPMKHDWTASASNQAQRARHSPMGPSVGGGGGGAEASTSSQSPPGAGPSPYAPAADPDPDPGNLPRYAMPLKNCGPTCPLDSLLLDFLSERRQRAAEGLPMHEVVGPRYPSVSSLLNPANSVYSHPLSKVFTDILTTFPDISALPERVAVLYIMFLVMRWQVAPTRENHVRLPPWMRPSPAQLLSPHPAWIDHLPFPAMRDALVRLHGQPEYQFDNFFIPFTTTLRLCWPYDEADTLLVVRPDAADDDEVVINPVFERHLRNLDNWRLGDRFVRAFPRPRRHVQPGFRVRRRRRRRRPRVVGVVDESLTRARSRPDLHQTNNISSHNLPGVFQEAHPSVNTLSPLISRPCIGARLVASASINTVISPPPCALPPRPLGGIQAV